MVASGSLEKVKLLIVQGTPFCNIDCRYCYLPNRSKKDFAPVSLFDKLASRLDAESLVGSELKVLFHAGEPLVYPSQGYQHCIDTFRKSFPETKISFSIQTNGTLIDEAWCQFFERNSITVGLSIDGPQEIHDLYRVTRSGKGTHADAIAGLQLLAEHSIPAHILSVVTHDSLTRARELYSYFSNLGAASISFNLEEVDGVNRSSTIAANASARRVEEFFDDLFTEITNRTQRRLWNREYENTLGNIFATSSGIADESRPFAILTIDSKGDIYTFSPELAGTTNTNYPNGFAIANVYSDALTIRSAEERCSRLFGEIAQGVKMCRQSCDYFEVCGSAYTSNKMAEHGTFAATETNQCCMSTKVPTNCMLRLVQSKAIANG